MALHKTHFEQKVTTCLKGRALGPVMSNCQSQDPCVGSSAGSMVSNWFKETSCSWKTMQAINIVNSMSEMLSIAKLIKLYC